MPISPWLHVCYLTQSDTSLIITKVFGRRAVLIEGVGVGWGWQQYLAGLDGRRKHPAFTPAYMSPCFLDMYTQMLGDTRLQQTKRAYCLGQTKTKKIQKTTISWRSMWLNYVSPSAGNFGWYSSVARGVICRSTPLENRPCTATCSFYVFIPSLKFGYLWTLCIYDTSNVCPFGAVFPILYISVMNRKTACSKSTKRYPKSSRGSDSI